jgi:hypothetical protein
MSLFYRVFFGGFMKLFGKKLYRFFLLLLTLVFFIANCTSQNLNTQNKSEIKNLLENKKFFSIKNLNTQNNNPFITNKIKGHKTQLQKEVIPKGQKFSQPKIKNTFNTKAAEAVIALELSLDNNTLGTNTSYPGLSFTIRAAPEEIISESITVEFVQQDPAACSLYRVWGVSTIDDTYELGNPNEYLIDVWPEDYTPNGNYLVRAYLTNRPQITSQTVNLFVDQKRQLNLTKIAGVNPFNPLAGEFPTFRIDTTSGDYIGLRVTGSGYNEVIVDCPDQLRTGAEVSWSWPTNLPNGRYEVRAVLIENQSVSSSYYVDIDVPLCYPGTPIQGVFNPDGTQACCPEGRKCNIGGGNPKPTPTITSTPSPSSSVSPSPSVEPSASPTSTPEPSTSPTSEPTPTPTNSPSSTPSPSPSSRQDFNMSITVEKGFKISSLYKANIGKCGRETVQINEEFSGIDSDYLPLSGANGRIKNSYGETVYVFSEKFDPKREEDNKKNYIYDEKTGTIKIKFYWDGKSNTRTYNGKYVPTDTYTFELFYGVVYYPDSEPVSGKIIKIDTLKIYNFDEPTGNSIFEQIVRDTDSEHSHEYGYLDTYPVYIGDGIIARSFAIDKLSTLMKQEGYECSEPANWFKMKGEAFVNKILDPSAGKLPNKTIEKAEVHWYEYRLTNGQKYYTRVKVADDTIKKTKKWLGVITDPNTYK